MPYPKERFIQKLIGKIGSVGKARLKSLFLKFSISVRINNLGLVDHKRIPEALQLREGKIINNLRNLGLIKGCQY